MKPRARALFVLSLIASAGVGAFLGSASVQGVAAQEVDNTYKIGIVDLQAVMDGYNKSKEEIKKLEAEFEGVQGKLDKMRDEFTSEKEKYQEKRDTLSPEEQAKREEELDNQLLELRTEYQRADADLERTRARLKKRLLADMVKAIDEIGAQENYHMILEADPETRTGVLYFTSRINMTQKVIDHLNVQLAKDAS